jgi:hypothetical protein
VTSPGDPAARVEMPSHSTAEPTPFLRYAHGSGKLQQEWIVTRYDGDFPGRQTREWRDVPTEGEGEGG